MKLTQAEKLILSMLCDVHRALKIETVNIDVLEEAIHNGHTWALDWEFPGIAEIEDDTSTQKSETLNILGMWEDIEEQYASLSDAEKKKVSAAAAPYEPKFMGFDGNNEVEYVSIARFLIEKLKRYSHFSKRDLNSHMTTLPGYRRMLTVYEGIPSFVGGKQLTSDQIAALLKAQAT